MCREFFTDSQGNDCYVEIYSNGDRTYRLAHTFEFHRLDGPSVDWKTCQLFHHNGKRLSKEECERFCRLKAFW